MPGTESPLPTAALHILLAIGPEARHGYAIMSEVSASTAGAVRLAPGTLYTNIKRLLAAGLIEEVEPPVLDETDDARRRYYRLTMSGRGAGRRRGRADGGSGRSRPRLGSGAISDEAATTARTARSCASIRRRFRDDYGEAMDPACSASSSAMPVPRTVAEQSPD